MRSSASSRVAMPSRATKWQWPRRAVATSKSGATYLGHEGAYAHGQRVFGKRPQLTRSARHARSRSGRCRFAAIATSRRAYFLAAAAAAAVPFGGCCEAWRPLCGGFGVGLSSIARQGISECWRAAAFCHAGASRNRGHAIRRCAPLESPRPGLVHVELQPGFMSFASSGLNDRAVR